MCWLLPIESNACLLLQLPFSERHFVFAAGVYLREWVAKKLVNYGGATLIDRAMSQCLHLDSLEGNVLMLDLELQCFWWLVVATTAVEGSTASGEVPINGAWELAAVGP